jgi:hypothetical protein
MAEVRGSAAFDFISIKLRTLHQVPGKRAAHAVSGACRPRDLHTVCKARAVKGSLRRYAPLTGEPSINACKIVLALISGQLRIGI